MGFFKDILKKMVVTKLGVVTGSDFSGGFLATGHKNGMPALIIFGFGKEDYAFTKEDVSEFSVFEQNARFLIDDNPKIGNKYRVIFKDGKSAILNIPGGECAKIEAMFY